MKLYLSIPSNSYKNNVSYKHRELAKLICDTQDTTSIITTQDTNSM